MALTLTGSLSPSLVSPGEVVALQALYCHFVLTLFSDFLFHWRNHFRTLAGSSSCFKKKSWLESNTVAQRLHPLLLLSSGPHLCCSYHFQYPHWHVSNALQQRSELSVCQTEPNLKMGHLHYMMKICMLRLKMHIAVCVWSLVCSCLVRLLWNIRPVDLLPTLK